LGSESPEGLEKSRGAFREELKRCHLLGIPYLNFHPGTAGKASEEECIERIVESLLDVEELAAKGETRLLIETTAGQGTSVGHRFEHLAAILDGVKGKVKAGVCIDTCHIFVAGYDIRTKEGWEKVIEEFDQVVGLKHLYAFHLNDSMKPLGSKVDRHAGLGEGEIGLECFEWVMSDSRVKWLPKYLETPVGLDGWKKEIALLKKYAKGG
jgi:deoxyribonuclease-4